MTLTIIFFLFLVSHFQVLLQEDVAMHTQKLTAVEIRGYAFAKATCAMAPPPSPQPLESPLL